MELGTLGICVVCPSWVVFMEILSLHSYDVFKKGGTKRTKLMLKIMNDLISWFSEGISPTLLYITSTVFFAMNTKVIYVYESQMCILHSTAQYILGQ